MAALLTARIHPEQRKPLQHSAGPAACATATTSIIRRSISSSAKLILSAKEPTHGIILTMTHHDIGNNLQLRMLAKCPHKNPQALPCATTRTRYWLAAAGSLDPRMNERTLFNGTHKGPRNKTTIER